VQVRCVSRNDEYNVSAITTPPAIATRAAGSSVAPVTSVAWTGATSRGKVGEHEIGLRPASLLAAPAWPAVAATDNRRAVAAQLFDMLACRPPSASPALPAHLPRRLPSAEAVQFEPDPKLQTTSGRLALQRASAVSWPFLVLLAGAPPRPLDGVSKLPAADRSNQRSSGARDRMRIKDLDLIQQKACEQGHGSIPTYG
jgi:hypothetical protein